MPHHPSIATHNNSSNCKTNSCSNRETKKSLPSLMPNNWGYYGQERTDVLKDFQADGSSLTSFQCPRFFLPTNQTSTLGAEAFLARSKTRGLKCLIFLSSRGTREKPLNPMVSDYVSVLSNHCFIPLSPDVKMHILLIVGHTFLVELVRRICLDIKTSYPWWSLSLFSSRECLNYYW